MTKIYFKILWSAIILPIVLLGKAVSVNVLLIQQMNKSGNIGHSYDLRSPTSVIFLKTSKPGLLLVEHSSSAEISGIPSLLTFFPSFYLCQF